MRAPFARRLLIALVLLLSFGVALALRVVPGYERVFVAGSPPRVDFHEVDPWYHVRAIEHQVANFPERFAFDPYLRFPDGGDVPVAPLFDWTVAAAALAAGFGRPDSRTIEIVAAWAPAVLGALAVLPVALLAFRIAAGSRLVAALFAGALFAVLPGQQLARSLLGFTDHHALEVLLSTAFLAALAGALDERRTAFARHLSTLLAGLSLLGLLLTWVGAASVLLVFALFVGVAFAVDVAARRPVDWLERVVLPALAIALVGVVALHDGVVVPTRNLVATAGTSAGAALLAVSARAGAGLGARPGARLGARATIVLSAGLLSAIAVGAAAVLAPGALGRAVAELDRFVRPGELVSTVSEAGPLSALGPLGPALWYEFALAGPLAAAFLLSLLALWVTRRAPPSRGELLLLVWSCGFFLLAVKQNRFLYYLSAPMAVAAALAVGALERALARRDLGDSSAAAAPPPVRSGDAARQRLGRGLILAGVAVAAIGLSLRPALARAAVWNGPSDDWREVLAWLRSSTPEPFGDATHYWRAVERQDAGRPRAAYAVGSWWDHGYWILRGAHRVPAADPTQAGAAAMARLLLATSDAVAAPLAESAGVRYLVVDAGLPLLLRGPARLPSGKFSAIARWAGEAPERYYERVERREADGKLQPYTLFHADYYRTLLVRLYLFAGRGVEPAGVSYVAELAPAGASGHRELVQLESFPSYAAAVAALAGRDPQRFEIVGLDPAVTAVPLPASTRFRRVHGSPTAVLALGDRRVSAVEVFELVGAGASRSGGGV